MNKMFNDPRTIIVKEGGEELLATNLLYVVPETILAESKYFLPAIVHSRPPDYDHQGLVVDVLSVGSRTRPEYVSYYSTSHGILSLKECCVTHLTCNAYAPLIR